MDNAVVVANGKGGVGKTTLVANLAGLAAHSGWEVLAVDLDRQANLGSDLGYRGTEGDDDGRGLFEAAADGAALVPLRGVREGLDVLPGGRWSRRLADRLDGDRGRLREVLEPVAAGYDLVVLDCPPADETMIAQALVAAGGLVVPVRPDAASLQGLQLMAEQHRRARQHNPGLRLLGVVLFGVSRAATAIRAEVRDTLERALGRQGLVLDAAIGYAERPAYDMRMQGLLAHEYEASTDEAKRRRLAMLRDGTPTEQLPRHSAAAEGLAGDFAAVAEEVLGRLVVGSDTEVRTSA